MKVIHMVGFCKLLIFSLRSYTESKLSYGLLKHSPNFFWLLIGKDLALNIGGKKSGTFVIFIFNILVQLILIPSF